MPRPRTHQTTVNQDEVDKFSAIAEEWWDPKGKFRPLHKINPIRLEYIRDILVKHFNLNAGTQKPLKGIKILDVGCGGGLLTIPLHNMGADITGLDASQKNINVASAYAQKNGLNINFSLGTIEKQASARKKFDVVIALEIIEHVSDTSLFISSLAKLVKPGGIIIISTINRTLKSLALAKIGAEYILKWVPIGTHSWRKFLKPLEINNLLHEYNFKNKSLKGISFNPLLGDWYLSDNTDVNYIACYSSPPRVLLNILSNSENND